jgi:hypothetical protein
MRWVENGERTGKRKAYRILIGTPEENRPIWLTIYRYVVNMKMALGEIGSGGMNWTDQGQDKDQWKALVKKVSKFRAPYDFGNLLNSWTTSGFSRRAQLHRAIVTF